MINVFRSLNYYVRKDLAIVIAFITIASLPIVSLSFMSALEGLSLSDMTGAVYFAEMNRDVVIISLVAALLIATRLVGTDFSDRSVNYEILGGNRRITSYLGRIAAGLLWGCIVCWILMSLPLGYLSLINGWGVTVDIKWALFRQVLMFLPLLRFVSLLIFVTILVRGAGKGMALAVVILEVEAIIDTMFEEILDIKIKYALAASNLMRVLGLDNAKNMVIDGKQVNVYIADLPGNFVAATIAVSLIMTVMYLSVAALVFLRKDRD